MPGSADGQVEVVQIRSSIGARPKHRSTLRALGLRRIGHSNVLPNRPEIRGMITAVAHLVRVRPSDGTTEGMDARPGRRKEGTIKALDGRASRPVSPQVAVPDSDPAEATVAKTGAAQKSPAKKAAAASKVPAAKKAAAKKVAATKAAAGKKPATGKATTTRKATKAVTGAAKASGTSKVAAKKAAASTTKAPTGQAGGKSQGKKP